MLYKSVQAWKNRTISAKLFSFALIGVLNVAVDVAVFTLLYMLLHLPLILSNVLAWALAVTGSYAMNSKITFGRETGGAYLWSDYLRFAASGVIGVTMATITLLLISQYANLPAAKLASIAVAFAFNFSTSHFIVFRRTQLLDSKIVEGTVPSHPQSERDDAGRLLGLPISMPLVLDMDGTLIAGDMLVKSFTFNFRRNPFIALLCLGWLVRGRPFLKRQLALRYQIDWSAIEFHRHVVDLAMREKVAGRSIVLATAADREIALKVASHLRIFNQVFASNENINFKGSKKAMVLSRNFPAGFIYAGDSAADLAVWKHAAGILLVNARDPVVAAARNLGRPVLELS